jgi:hypothetical protein
VQEKEESNEGASEELDDSSSSDDEDEDAAMAKPVVADFMKLIPMLRNKHPDIYNKERKFFASEYNYSL